MYLPRRLIKEIVGVCRAFLWKCTTDSDGPGKIAWDVVCKRKAAGGLGVKDIIKWNQSALFKHIWAVENKKDNMWVK